MVESAHADLIGAGLGVVVERLDQGELRSAAASLRAVRSHRKVSRPVASHDFELDLNDPAAKSFSSVFFGFRQSGAS